MKHLHARTGSGCWPGPDAGSKAQEQGNVSERENYRGESISRERVPALLEDAADAFGEQVSKIPLIHHRASYFYRSAYP